MSGTDVAEQRLHALERLSDVATRIASSLDLPATLHAVSQAVVDSLGFGAAVLNVVDGEVVRTAALAGPPEMRELLLDRAYERSVWDQLLARSIPLGGLRFVDGRSDDNAGLDELLAWVPDIEADDEADSWHPMDALFAPLHGWHGDLVGVLSVDMPRDGRRPDAAGVEMLERFAVLAGLAIDRARMHQRVADSAELFRHTFDDAPVGMALLHLDGTVDRANRAFAALAGRPAGVLRGTPSWMLTHPAAREGVRASLRALGAGEYEVLGGDVRSAAGRTGRVTTSRITGPDGPRLPAQVIYVTEEHRATSQLRAQALTDPLTGLLNRAGLTAHLDTLLEQRRAAERSVGVIFCDLDLFKLVNDTHGHATGDALLVEVARALRSTLRAEDAAARFGGDEFVIVLDGCDGPAPAIAAAQRVRDAVCRPRQVGDVCVQPALSMGIALSGATTRAEELLADADTALYRAKESGRGRWEVFSADMRVQALARLSLREQLRGALPGGQLELHYQPVVELVTGRVVGYEALLRWRHPDRGLLAPAEFLDELMRGDMAGPATDWVVERAVADAGRWPASYGVHPIVSVNVSSAQLSRFDLPAVIVDTLHRHGLAPDRLCVEVTEEALIAGPEQLATLAALRAAGVHVALDDFGSGYAGLLALRDVPADVVKLDRALTGTFQSDPVGRAIVESVIDLCARLDRTLVAEGLQTTDTRDALVAAGVRLGQGFLLGRPQPLPAAGAAPAAAVRPPHADLAAVLRLLDATLAAAANGEQLGQAAVAAARELAGVAGGSLVLRDGAGGLRTAYAEGYPAEIVNRFAVLPADAPQPVAQAVRSGQPVWVADEVRLEALHAHGAGGAHVALAAFPLAVDGGVLGGLGLSWTEPVQPHPVLQVQLGQVATRVAARLAALGAAAA